MILSAVAWFGSCYAFMDMSAYDENDKNTNAFYMFYLFFCRKISEVKFVFVKSPKPQVKRNTSCLNFLGMDIIEYS